LFTHKTVFGTQNPAFWVGAVIASGSCPPSLQTIVSIEFLCHFVSAVRLRIFYFFEALENFLIQFFLGLRKKYSLKKNCLQRWLVRF